ncbi:RAPID ALKALINIZATION FACTOR-LIKE [Salix purpurea]|uniref:RAPID ALKALINIZATION FACTOR-LIKE n=1 Tax=Salix purpurea TaxID=77065 RepID=A0A9Q0P056_SALPP|nr:RAPID ALKALINIZATION FACTOR-LIKE [Salix purpurea]
MRVSALTLIVVFLAFLTAAKAQADLKDFIQLTSEALEWPSTMSVNDELSDSEDEEYGGGSQRRSMYGGAKHYYISYGALSANRVPCPARSGRSYYTHDCFRSRGQANPLHQRLLLYHSLQEIRLCFLFRTFFPSV